MTEKAKGLAGLNEEFDKSITTSHRINCEKRTNLNLYLGHHFLKTSDSLNRRLEKRGVDKTTRVRVTKNHMFRICEYIKNAIISAGADHDVFPENEDEMQDQKSAELHRAILSKWKHQNNYKDICRSFVSDFVIDGEVARKITWNPNKGEVVSKEIVFNEETGEQSEKVTKEGDATVERIFAWDLIVPENVKDISTAPWLGYQKMMPTATLKESVPEELKAKITDSSDKTFEIFDPTMGGYHHRKGMTLVREKYTKPCGQYPTGFVQIFNEDIVIHQGPIPEGHPFPIKIKGYTEVPTSPRSVSIIRQLRPLQVNINFAASQEILTQMTVGHDKLIMLGGASLQHVGSQHGIEKFKTNSMSSPTILPGRSGGQFVESMVRNTTEMYSLANVPEMDSEKGPKNSDAIGALFASVKDKRRFTLQTEKFTEFMQEIIEDVLQLKKLYMNEQEIVKVVGRTEQVNISEYKNAEKIGYQIRVNEVDENETQLMGKHIELTNMLQYGGNDLGPETTALIGRNMPFLNKTQIFDDVLVNYDAFVNIILALDRGQQIEVQPHDDTDYLLKKVTTRMRKADFRFMNQEIQASYQQFIQQLHQVKAQQIRELQQQQANLIPTSGARVPLPIYRETIGSNGQPKSERVMVPQDGLSWFIDLLEQQGTVIDPMQLQEQSTQANIATILNMQGQPVQA